MEVRVVKHMSACGNFDVPMVSCLQEVQRGKILSGTCLSHCFPQSGWSIARRGMELMILCMCVCVCKSVCLSAYRNPLLSTLHIFDDHGIMCLQYSDYPPTHAHANSLSSFFLFFKGSEHQQGPPFLWMSHICLLISAPIPLFLSLAPCFSLWLRLCLKD